MATVAPPADQTADLLKNLSLDSQSKTLEIPDPNKKASVVSGDIGNGQSQPIDRSITPLIPDFKDPAVAYYPNNYASTAYYYGGYDGATNEWEDYSRYVNHDGVDLSHGVYGDNGSLMYHGYGYAPYGPYSPAASPVPTVGHDGPFYGAQHYQYPSPYFPPMTPTSGPYSTASAPPKGEISAPVAGDQALLSVDNASGNPNAVVNGAGVKGSSISAPVRQTTYGSYGGGARNAYPDPRFGFDGVRSPIPWLDGSMYSDGQRRNGPIPSSVTNGSGVASRNPNSRYSQLVSPRQMSGINTANGYINNMYPNKLYGQYANTCRSGYGLGSHAYDSRNNGRGWLAVDNKYKPKGKGNAFFGYNNENADGLNELNRGPRAKNVLAPVTIAVKGQSLPLTRVDDVTKEEKKPSVSLEREQYNRADFPETYADAKFFVIKSYSEDDVHKSIKYNVWASTQNGNKKLDTLYHEARQKSGECPVFLFFSVNTSGQFVGVAEMVGPVDFNKSLEYWQQDKWIGCFPVKWHIVKDLPNTLLKHITLENNENKPVTNSRDTQEVKLEQGLQILKIFKEHSSKQCILDDFEFYEERQKRIQEKKAKLQQFQKQAWEGKPNTDIKIKDNIKLDVAPPKPVDAAATSVQINGDVKLSENETVLKPVSAQKPAAKAVGDVAKTSSFVQDKKITPNGVASNGC